MAADAAFAGYTGYVLQRTQTVLLPAAGFAAKYKIHKIPPRLSCAVMGGLFLLAAGKNQRMAAQFIAALSILSSWLSVL